MPFDYVTHGVPTIPITGTPALAVDATNGTLYVGNPATGAWVAVNPGGIGGSTGTGAVVLQTSPTLIGPDIGAANAQSIVGTSSTLFIVGKSGASGGLVLVGGTPAAVAGTAGGIAALQSANGTTTGTGGDGGIVSLTAGAAKGDGTVARAGGSAVITAGNGIGTGSPGNVVVTAGNAGASG